MGRHRVLGEAVAADVTERVTDPMTLSGHLFEDGQTTAERELAEEAGIRTFLTTVTAVEDVHPHLRRITFGGGDLGTFAPIGPDTFCYVLLPPPGRRRADGRPVVHVGAPTATMPPEEQPVGAYYTVRAWRPTAAELDMLFVIHDDGRGDDVGGAGGAGRPGRAVGPAHRVPPTAPTRRGCCSPPTRPDCPPSPRSSSNCPPGLPARVARRGGRRARAPGAAGGATASRSRGCTATAPRPARRRCCSMPSGRWTGRAGRRTCGAPASPGR